MDDSCVFCSGRIAAGDLVIESEHWQLFINWNQDHLGKCQLALRRHEEDVTKLETEEQQELFQLLRRTKGALDALFKPDHYNYAFLMNQDRHTHFHVIPRYVASREFAGLIFDDGWPGENATRRIVEPAVREELATAMRENM